MVTTYGMSELGPVQYSSGNVSVFLGRDYNSPMNVSSQIAYDIDVEVRKIIDKAHDDAITIINAHKDELVKIAEALIVNETLTKEEIDDILSGKLIIKDQKLVKAIEDEPKEENETVDNSTEIENKEE